MNTYTDAELDKMLAEMRIASSAFYGAAVRIGNHAFIEFTGLMNEYIQVCEHARRRGEDFTQANIHTGEHQIPSYMMAYFAEKMSCILGVELDVKQRRTG